MDFLTIIFAVLLALKILQSCVILNIRTNIYIFAQVNETITIILILSKVSHKNVIYISVIVQQIKKLKSQLTFLTRSGLAIFWRPTYFVYWSMTAASQTVNKQE